MQTTAPDTGATAYGHDAAGNLTSVTNAKGQTMSRSYDALNRPVIQSVGGKTILFAYDQGSHAIGRLSGITDGEGTTSFAYDAAGRVVSKTRMIGSTTHTIGYSYDPATGEPSGMTYPSGMTVSYTRDANGRISGISLNGAELVSGISRLPFGPLKSATLGATTLTRSHDQRYNLTGIKAGSFDATFTRDAAGHVTGITGIAAPMTISSNTTSTYNPANNQLTAAPPKSYSYDANGNMVYDGTSTFTWDGLNRLIKVQKGSATVAEYGYDAANRRIRKTVGATTTHYLYDLNNQLIAETLANGTVLREYIHLDGEPLALKEYQTNPGTFYFINDHLGTPQQLITASGAIVWQAAYLPFGQAQIKTAMVSNNLRFPGQYYDAETGLHYNWHRFYDPEVGRYISADPIGLDGWMNLYAYVGGNPLNAIDPMGLCWSNARAVLHYESFLGGIVPLSQTGCVAQVTAATQGARDSWTNILRGLAEGAAKSLQCPDGGEATISFSGSPGTHSGVWWIGGITLFNKATCKVKKDCCAHTWSYSCRLSNQMNDRFDHPFDLNNNNSDWYDNIETGRPFFVTHTWTNGIVGQGTF